MKNKRNVGLLWVVLLLFILNSWRLLADTNGIVTTPESTGLAVGGIPGSAILAGAVLLILKGIKESPIDNRWIPSIGLLLGAVLYMALTKHWDVSTAITGMLLGGSSTGIHQAVRAPIEAKQETGETTFLAKKDTGK
jgi:hypothetical protein